MRIRSTSRALYRQRNDRLPAAGCTLREPDLIVVRDGDSLLAVVPAPPFVTPDVHERFGEGRPLPGVNLGVKWIVGDVPKRGEFAWVQEFRDGVEQPSIDGEDGVSRDWDLEIECAYRDFAAYLLGVADISDAVHPVRVVKMTIGGLSALTGMMLDSRSLRAAAYPLELRWTLIGALDGASPP